MKRRQFLQSLGPFVSASLFAVPALSRGGILRSAQAGSRLRITGMDTFIVRATARTNWIFVRPSTNQGLTGLGEASMGRQCGPDTDLSDLEDFFSLVREESPFGIERYRQRGIDHASAGNRRVATAFSAIEQAQWDLVGKALDAPVHELFGGRLRDRLLVYANINRATSDRTPEGFDATAAASVADGNGFGALKAAPFDGFPPASAGPQEVEAATDLGVACVEAIRDAVGPSIEIKIDCHSFSDVERSISVARRLEPQRLSWYEEPIPPTQVENTRTIKNAISQPMAGGEFLFGMSGFDELCRRQAVDVIMPDVKHCGGLQEGRNIAALAAPCTTWLSRRTTQAAPSLPSPPRSCVRACRISTSSSTSGAKSTGGVISSLHRSDSKMERSRCLTAPASASSSTIGSCANTWRHVALSSFAYTTEERRRSSEIL